MEKLVCQCFVNVVELQAQISHHLKTRIAYGFAGCFYICNYLVVFVLRQLYDN